MCVLPGYCIGGKPCEIVLATLLQHVAIEGKYAWNDGRDDGRYGHWITARVGCPCLGRRLMAGPRIVLMAGPRIVLMAGPRIVLRWRLLRVLGNWEVDTLVASIHSSNSSRVRGIRPRIIGHSD